MRAGRGTVGHGERANFQSGDGTGRTQEPTGGGGDAGTAAAHLDDEASDPRLSVGRRGLEEWQALKEAALRCSVIAYEMKHPKHRPRSSAWVEYWPEALSTRPDSDGQQGHVAMLGMLPVLSDGAVLGMRVGDCGFNEFIGAESDLRRNWTTLLDAAGLTEALARWFTGQVAEERWTPAHWPTAARWRSGSSLSHAASRSSQAK